MIKANKDEVELKGSAIGLIYELSLVVRSVHKALVNAGATEKEAKEDIMNAIETAFMTDEEIEKELLKLLDSVKEMIKRR